MVWVGLRWFAVVCGISMDRVLTFKKMRNFLKTSHFHVPRMAGKLTLLVDFV